MKKKVSLVRRIDKYSSTSLNLREEGYDFYIQVIQSGIIEANRSLSTILNVPIASLIFMIKRLRIVEGIPKTIETSYIPYELVKGIENIDFAVNSLYRTLIEKFSLSINESSEEIMLVSPSEEESKLLMTPQNSDVLMLKGITTDDYKRNIEYYETIAVTDFFIFRSVLVE